MVCGTTAFDYPGGESFDHLLDLLELFVLVLDVFDHDVLRMGSEVQLSFGL